jgi:hypothetical protein
MHHFSTIGDNWEVFLIRNSFVQADPTTNPILIVNPNLDKPMVKDQFNNSTSGPEFIDINPIDEGAPSKSSPARFPKQETVKLKVIDPLLPMIDVILNVMIKSNVKKPFKGT